MDMTGEFRLAAPRETVWKALNDPAILKQSIPGCEDLVKISDTELTARVSAKVGPVSTKFNGKVTLSELDPPNGYTISGEGQGGVAGFARGGAQVRLEPDGTGTLLRYTVQAQIGGKLAQIGSRLIDATARKMAEDFFARFAAAVAAAAPTTQATPPAAVAEGAPAANSAAASPATSGGRVPAYVWAALLTGAVAVILYIFTRS